MMYLYWKVPLRRLGGTARASSDDTRTLPPAVYRLISAGSTPPSPSVRSPSSYAGSCATVAECRVCASMLSCASAARRVAPTRCPGPSKASD